MHKPQRASRNGKILRVNGNRFSVYRPGTNDNTVAVKDLFIHIKIFGLMLYEHVVLMKRTGIDNPLNSLTGSQFPHRILLLNRFFTTTLEDDFFSLP